MDQNPANENFNRALEAGFRLKSEQRYSDALRCLRYAENIRESAGVSIEIGVCLEGLEQHGDAITAYRKALESQPPPPSDAMTFIFNRIGLCSERIGDREALTTLVQSNEFVRHLGPAYSINLLVLWTLRLDLVLPIAETLAASRALDPRFHPQIVEILSIYVAKALTRDEDVSEIMHFLQETPYGRSAIDIISGYSHNKMIEALRATTLLSAEHCINKIVQHIETGERLSMIRFGDGEGNFLGGFHDGRSPFLQAQKDKALHIWFADNKIDPSGQAAIEVRLVEALRDADLLGIPDEARLGYEISNDPRGYWGVYFSALLALALRRATTGITFAGLHGALFESERFIEALRGASAINTISCHKHFGGAIRAKLGVARGSDLIVPGEMAMMALPEASRSGAHYPRVYSDTISAIHTWEAGSVALIAAGLLGKIYAHNARSVGCIALDIGAAADQIMGAGTRRSFRSLRNLLA